MSLGRGIAGILVVIAIAIKITINKNNFFSIITWCISFRLLLRCFFATGNKACHDDAE